MSASPSNHSAQPTFHRTQRLIDPRWQLGVACVASLVLLGTGALYLFGSRLLMSPRVINAIGSDALPLVSLVCDVTFFLGVVGLIHMLVVRMTHSVVGPAFVVERGLTALTEGDFTARFSLRDGDYLLPVAEAGGRLRDRMKQQRTELAAALEDISTAAGDNADVRAARARIEEIFGIEGADPEDDEDEREIEQSAAA